MQQKQFARKATDILRQDPSVIGLAAAGSWLSDELDEYSDLDLILVTREKVGGDREKMMAYASQLGVLLAAFTGEHVGEPRLLICLFDEPLLHVDIKFITPAEFAERIETPELLLDRDGELQKILDQTRAAFPYPDHQWIEDRFWTWIHYALLKTGRGEYLEAVDFLGFLRMTVLGPLLHIKNGNLPRGVRRVESTLPAADLSKLLSTLPVYKKEALIEALEKAADLYKDLRKELYHEDVLLHREAEEKVMAYLQQLKN